MHKRLISLFLFLSVCLFCFAGCQAQKTETESQAVQEAAEHTEADDYPQIETESDAAESDLEIPEPDSPAGVALNAFDDGLIQYLNQSDLGNGNYAVSPLSFRAALALAALGSEGETLDQLLYALGYTERDDLIAWYRTVLDGVDSFDSYFEGERILDRGDAAYQVVNSVWNNEDLPGEFRESYIALAEEQLRAEVRSAAAEKLADAVNEWVNEKTNGMIPALLSDASDASSILVNALYLKAGWEETFNKLGDDNFLTATGETVQKEYIRSLGNYGYYEDEGCQLVAVTLQGGIRMVFVLGDDDRFSEKLALASLQRVDVTVPMFEVETTLNQHELVSYLKSLGCERMFDSMNAEFDPMFTEELHIDDIIQKSKVSIDEEGLEAAAATAIIMYGNTAVQDPPEPKIFRADRPFRFYILNGTDSPELLFYGQINQ